jgi:hypothetical protein
MNRSMGRLVRFGSAAMAFALLALPSTWAKWMHPEDMPVSRLLKNVREYIVAHPKDPHGYYTLGRINSAAFALDTENIGVYMHDGLPSLPTHPDLSPPARDKTKPLSPQALIYLSDAASNYKKAISLDGADGLTWLGIKRIAVHSAGIIGGVPANSNGVQLRDGSFLPTFDWTPTSLSTLSTRARGLQTPP